MDEHFDLIIIGAGPAGLTSAIYGQRSGLETLVLEEKMAGGTVNDAPKIDNYPGLEDITGSDLSEKMKNHALKYVDILENHVVKDIEINDSFLVKSNKKEYEADAIIFATGTEYQRLDVPGEQEFSGKGVSYCATCDGFFFKDKSVLVVGGGNTALIDASYLLDLGCDVKVIHRRDELRAEKALEKSFFEKGGEVIWNSVVEEIKGDNKVESVRLRNLEEDSEQELELEVDGVFISIGAVPRSDLASEIGVEIDESSYIKTDEDQRTNIPRVYAAGDITGGHRQVITACGEGAVAALSAYKDVRDPYW